MNILFNDVFLDVSKNVSNTLTRILISRFFNQTVLFQPEILHADVKPCVYCEMFKFLLIYKNDDNPPIIIDKKETHIDSQKYLSQLIILNNQEIKFLNTLFVTQIIDKLIQKNNHSLLTEFLKVDNVSKDLCDRFRLNDLSETSTNSFRFVDSFTIAIEKNYQNSLTALIENQTIKASISSNLELALNLLNTAVSKRKSNIINLILNEFVDLTFTSSVFLQGTLTTYDINNLIDTNILNRLFNYAIENRNISNIHLLKRYVNISISEFRNAVEGDISIRGIMNEQQATINSQFFGHLEYWLTSLKSQSDNPEFLRSLDDWIKRGVNINALCCVIKNDIKCTPLVYAIFNNYTGLIKSLIRMGAEI